MNIKLVCICSLVSFVFVGGVFGFPEADPGSEYVLQATLPAVEPTLVIPGMTQSVGIPVSGEPEPVWMEILVFYGLIGLTALFLILALLNLANKSTVRHVEDKAQSSDETHQN